MVPLVGGREVCKLFAFRLDGLHAGGYISRCLREHWHDFSHIWRNNIQAYTVLAFAFPSLPLSCRIGPPSISILASVHELSS